MALISLPKTFSISFLRYPYLSFILMGVLCVFSLGGLFLKGLTLGVDFRGGLVIEAQVSDTLDVNLLRKQLKSKTARDFSIQQLEEKNSPGKISLLIRTEKVEETSSFLETIKPFLGKDVVYRKIESIGPKVGGELIKNGCYAILGALISMMAFVWIRFEWQFSLCAFVALVHDCLGLLAFLVWYRMEFNEGAVVAILITAAYSINDTVVIFDRLRDNLAHFPEKPFVELINVSLNETLARTLLTSSTTLLAVLMLYLFGGEVIASFSLPIFVGILIGTYSSIIIAVPLLRWLPMSRRKTLGGKAA
jgi:preprotein translocase SecF subunit